MRDQRDDKGKGLPHNEKKARTTRVFSLEQVGVKKTVNVLQEESSILSGVGVGGGGYED